MVKTQDSGKLKLKEEINVEKKNKNENMSDENNKKKENTTDVETDNSYKNEYLEIEKEINKLQEQLSVLKSRLKKFYKSSSKQLSRANKNKKNNPREPTGFGIPTPIPDSLKVLLNLKENDVATRPELTKKLYEYIVVNNLRYDKDKRVLRVDDNLKSALKLSDIEINSINNSISPKDKNGLNFFNIQKYVARLYQLK